MPGVRRYLAMCFGVLHIISIRWDLCSHISKYIDGYGRMRAKRRTLRTQSTSVFDFLFKSHSLPVHFASAMASQEPKNGAVPPPSAAAESTPSPQSQTQLTAMSLRVPLLDAASHVIAPDLFPAPLPPPPLPPPIPLQRESFEIVEAGDECSHLPSDRCPMILKQTDHAVACKRIRVPSGGKKVELVNRLAEKGATTTS
jgi:hypothetical protein